MEHTCSYSVKGVLAALGKSLLYLLFFIMAQFLTGVVYTAAVVGQRNDYFLPRHFQHYIYDSFAYSIKKPRFIVIKSCDFIRF